MKIKNHVWLFRAALLLTLFIFTSDLYSQTGFTQQDREMLIELKATMKEIDKRFEQIDKRISELREDMNKRFEQVDKRFEQVDKRFEQMMNFIWILAALFGGMLTVTISFALWDRRTMIRPFETKVAEIDRQQD